MKLGMIISQTDPETVFNALRLALYSLEQGDQVRIFLSGRGVEIDDIEDARFNVRELARKILDAGGNSWPAAPVSNFASPRAPKSAPCPPSRTTMKSSVIRTGWSLSDRSRAPSPDDVIMVETPSPGVLKSREAPALRGRCGGGSPCFTRYGEDMQ